MLFFFFFGTQVGLKAGVGRSQRPSPQEDPAPCWAVPFAFSQFSHHKPSTFQMLFSHSDVQHTNSIFL